MNTKKKQMDYNELKLKKFYLLRWSQLAKSSRFTSEFSQFESIRLRSIHNFCYTTPKCSHQAYVKLADNPSNTLLITNTAMGEPPLASEVQELMECYVGFVDNVIHEPRVPWPRSNVLCRCSLDLHWLVLVPLPLSSFSEARRVFVSHFEVIVLFAIAVRDQCYNGTVDWF